MNDLAGLRLQDAWQQCARHLHHLKHALEAIRRSLPMTATRLKALDGYWRKGQAIYERENQVHE